MQEYFVPNHQQQLANRTVTEFVIDQRSEIEYTFNTLGFRSDELTPQPTVISVGNSITFGIGLPYSHTFTSLVGTKLNRPSFNMSFGCFKHENSDHLRNLQIIAKREEDDILLVQLNNISRRRVSKDDVITTQGEYTFDLSRLRSYVDEVSELFKNKKLVFLHWDDVGVTLPQDISARILIYNKLHLDVSLPTHSDTFGVASHRAVANVIAEHLRRS